MKNLILFLGVAFAQSSFASDRMALVYVCNDNARLYDSVEAGTQDGDDTSDANANTILNRLMKFSSPKTAELVAQLALEEVYPTYQFTDSVLPVDVEMKHMAVPAGCSIETLQFGNSVSRKYHSMLSEKDKTLFMTHMVIEDSFLRSGALNSRSSRAFNIILFTDRIAAMSMVQWYRFVKANGIALNDTFTELSDKGLLNVMFDEPHSFKIKAYFSGKAKNANYRLSDGSLESVQDLKGKILGGQYPTEIAQIGYNSCEVDFRNRLLSSRPAEIRVNEDGVATMIDVGDAKECYLQQATKTRSVIYRSYYKKVAFDEQFQVKQVLVSKNPQLYPDNKLFYGPKDVKGLFEVVLGVGALEFYPSLMPKTFVLQKETALRTKEKTLGCSRLTMFSPACDKTFAAGTRVELDEAGYVVQGTVVKAN